MVFEKKVTNEYAKYKHRRTSSPRIIHSVNHQFYRVRIMLSES